MLFCSQTLPGFSLQVFLTYNMHNRIFREPRSGFSCIRNIFTDVITRGRPVHSSTLALSMFHIAKQTASTTVNRTHRTKNKRDFLNNSNHFLRCKCLKHFTLLIGINTKYITLYSLFLFCSMTRMTGN